MGSAIGIALNSAEHLFNINLSYPLGLGFSISLLTAKFQSRTLISKFLPGSRGSGWKPFKKSMAVPMALDSAIWLIMGFEQPNIEARII